MLNHLRIERGGREIYNMPRGVLLKRVIAFYFYWVRKGTAIVQRDIPWFFHHPVVNDAHSIKSCARLLYLWTRIL